MRNNIWVIIPVYNAERYVREAVESVFAAKDIQPFVVLIDDGSLDGSGEICDQLAKEYKQVIAIHQENGGVSRARNTGIEYVLNQDDEGYIAFLDADDRWAPGIAFLPLNKEADLIAFSSVLMNEEGNKFRILHRFSNEIMVGNDANVQWINYGHFGAYLYNLRLFRRYKLQFMPGIKGNEDIIFWRQATFCAKVVEFREAVLYVYRMNHNSVTHTWKASVQNALHIPMAWYGAREWANNLAMYSEEEKKRWVKSCEELIGARLLESARELSGQSVSLQIVKKIIMQEPVYGYLECIEESALSPWQRKDLNMIRRSFAAFVLYHRVRGLFLRLGKRIMGIQFIRKMREKRRYPLSSFK